MTVSSMRYLLVLLYIVTVADPVHGGLWGRNKGDDGRRADGLRERTRGFWPVTRWFTRTSKPDVERRLGGSAPIDREKPNYRIPDTNGRQTELLTHRPVQETHRNLDTQRSRSSDASLKQRSPNESIAKSASQASPPSVPGSGTAMNDLSSTSSTASVSTSMTPPATGSSLPASGNGLSTRTAHEESLSPRWIALSVVMSLLTVAVAIRSLKKRPASPASPPQRHLLSSRHRIAASTTQKVAVMTALVGSAAMLAATSVLRRRQSGSAVPLPAPMTQANNNDIGFLDRYPTWVQATVLGVAAVFIGVCATFMIRRRVQTSRIRRFRNKQRARIEQLFQ